MLVIVAACTYLMWIDSSIRGTERGAIEFLRSARAAAPVAAGTGIAVQEQLASDVQHIYSTQRAFTALKADGTVVTWGHDDWGGDASTVQTQLVDVQHIYSPPMPLQH